MLKICVHIDNIPFSKSEYISNNLKKIEQHFNISNDITQLNKIDFLKTILNRDVCIKYSNEYLEIIDIYNEHDNEHGDITHDLKDYLIYVYCVYNLIIYESTYDSIYNNKNG